MAIRHFLQVINPEFSRAFQKRPTCFAKPFFVKSRFQNYARHFAKTGIEFIEIYEPGDTIAI